MCVAEQQMALIFPFTNTYAFYFYFIVTYDFNSFKGHQVHWMANNVYAISIVTLCSSTSTYLNFCNSKADEFLFMVS